MLHQGCSIAEMQRLQEVFVGIDVMEEVLATCERSGTGLGMQSAVAHGLPVLASENVPGR